MDDERRQEILYGLSQDKMFEVKFVVEWKQLNDMITAMLYDHYFAKFFDYEYEESEPNAQ